MLIDTNIGKDRLNNGQPSRIDFLALLAVDLGSHQIYQVRLAGIDLEEKGESFTKFLSKIPKNLTDEPSSQHRGRKGCMGCSCKKTIVGKNDRPRVYGNIYFCPFG